jgi:hypothetical protein
MRWITRSGLTVVAFLLLSGAALAEGVEVTAATDKQKKEAQKAFQSASAHYDAGRFDKAREGFSASYDIVKSPNSRLMIARSLRELGQLTAAYREYEGVMALATELGSADKRYQATAESAREELEALRLQVGLLSVELQGGSPNTDVHIGDQTIKASELAQAMPWMPGTVTVWALNAAGTAVEHQVDVAAGQTMRVTLDLMVPDEPAVAENPFNDEPEGVVVSTSGSSKRTLAYVAGGVGLAGLATFGVLGVMNDSKFSDLESACPNNRCPPDQQDNIDQGKLYQTIANVGLGVGVIGLGASAVLFLLSSDGPEQPQAAFFVKPESISVGPGSIQVRGRF